MLANGPAFKTGGVFSVLLLPENVGFEGLDVGGREAGEFDVADVRVDVQIDDGAAALSGALAAVGLDELTHQAV